MNNLRCNKCSKSAKPNQTSFDICERLKVDNFGKTTYCGGLIMLYEEDEEPVGVTLDLEGLTLPDVLSCYIHALKRRNKRITKLEESGYKQFQERELMKERIHELEQSLSTQQSRIAALEKQIPEVAAEAMTWVEEPITKMGADPVMRKNMPYHLANIIANAKTGKYREDKATYMSKFNQSQDK
jgi:hypothetical protein